MKYMKQIILISIIYLFYFGSHTILEKISIVVSSLSVLYKFQRTFSNDTKSLTIQSP